MVNIPAIDSFLLSGKIYPCDKSIDKNKVLIINSATAVEKKLYHHYASYMAENGYNVVTYDYRGIADSRPKKLRGFKASFTDWGQKDFSGVISYTKSKFPNHKIVILGHSIGGTIIGMTPKSTEISGIINIGAQTAYYKDWAKEQRTKIYILWHIVFPMITNLFGYFPGKRLGLLEDVPKGVIKQWNNRRKHANMQKQMEAIGITFYYDVCESKLLTLGVEDDPIGTKPAIMRIHDLFKKSDKEFKIIQLSEVETTKIGHFGFFSRKFKHTLWAKTLTWYDTI
ncbi:alpha/beta hydrolase family protein [Aquimarina sediminis]|uniref:alpha/beta hydrolase family protein n=1 Tax=Aquimarina sediminis TaxID=2070536 RepID=UPI000CA02A7A|nr:alpha/beta fold hydrolase [Aquimarina sediminis]